MHIGERLLPLPGQEERTMRMAELSARSGVPIPTIRYYLREGLLPAGELTSPNQAVYDDSHVRHLKLIRALIEVGGLSIAAVRDVQAFIAAKDGDLFATLGGVQYALTPRREPEDDDAARAARARVDKLLDERGWVIRDNNPARAALADVIATLDRVGEHAVVARLDDYADAVRTLAVPEVDDLLRRDSAEAAAEGVIAYDVLGDALISALRRLAQEDETARRLGTPAAK